MITTPFKSHLELAHSYWKELLKPGDHVIDATCGNGKDTYLLCESVLSALTGYVFACDIQEKAIIQTKKRTEPFLHPPFQGKLVIEQRSHASFPNSIVNESVTLIVYNLGYLPGGNKQIITETNTTLQSLQNAMTLLKPGGALSITCYSGHPGGDTEEESILEFASNLPSYAWNCCHHRWMNRKQSPSFLWIQKKG